MRAADRDSIGIKLDEGFKVFFDWCKAHDVPVVIVSSGMVPIIRGASRLGRESSLRGPES